MKVKKLIFKFIFHLFNYRAIKIVNLSKKNRNLYILSNYKKVVRLILKKNVINVVFLKIFSKALNLKSRLKKDRIEISL